MWSSVLGGEHPTEAETKKFRKILERELASGAMGVSLGLGYAPECFLTTDELISGLEPLRNTDIPITFHMRQEGDGVCDAIREVIKIGETLHAHVHISHLKAMGIPAKGPINETFTLLILSVSNSGSFALLSSIAALIPKINVANCGVVLKNSK